jgi:hypothetical protein
MEAIAALRERVRAQGEDIERHEQHLQKLDAAVVELKSAIATVATKDDILKLSRNIDDKFGTQLRDAQKSIPDKVAMIFGAGMFIMGLVGLIVNLMHGHG